MTNKLKLVIKADELELWIALLTTWNFITVQRNHWMLTVNKHCTVVITFIKRTPSVKRTLEKVLRVFI